MPAPALTLAAKVGLYLLRSRNGRKMLVAALAAVVAAVVAAIIVIIMVLSAAAAALSNPCMNPETAGPGGTPTGTSEPSEEAIGGIPSDYLSLYQQAGKDYGIDWAVIAGIGKVETDHGRYMDGCESGPPTAYGTAKGPMQFIDSTWASAGVDGDGDGDKDVCDPADAIPAAAGYLRDSGAPGNYNAAIYAYNHSDAYVADVLGWADKYRAAAGGGGGGGDMALVAVPGTAEWLSEGPTLARYFGADAAVAAPQGWDVVGGDRVVHWEDHTSYDSANEHGADSWKQLGSVGVVKGGGPLDISVGDDPSLAPGVGGHTSTNGTLLYNPSVMNASTGNAQEAIASHEWGHVMGLGHTPSGSDSVMNGVTTNATNNPASPTGQDEDVYYQIWGHEKAPEGTGGGSAPSGDEEGVPIACEPGTPGQDPGGGAIPGPGEKQQATGDANKVLQTAEEYMGVPYVLGGASFSGIDCSGLTMRAYESVGISLPHWDDKQLNYGTPVDQSELQPGDLVFFNEHAGEGPTTHVALYYGDGKIIHASSYAGETTITPMQYLTGYVGARRLL